METLGCIYAWAMWEEQEKKGRSIEDLSIQVPLTSGLVIWALTLTPLINLHPAIASTLLTQANQNQTFTTSQIDFQPEVEESNGIQNPETVNPEEVCKVAANSRYLRMGSAGEEVRLLQIQLNNWGFPVNSVDGIFGPETCAAVVQFQSFHDLKADGIVGPKTSQVLWSPRTDNVQMVQTQLNNWGFSVKNVDNVFDDETRAAVVQFQEYRGLEPIGVVDRETSQALWTPRPEAIAQVTHFPTPSPTATPESSPVTDSTPEPTEAIAQVTPSPTPSPITAPEPSPVTDSTPEPTEAIAQVTPSPTPSPTATSEPPPECREFLDRLAENESGGDGGYRAIASNTRNIGRYQFGEALLKDLGYYSVENPYLYEKAQSGGKTQNTWDDGTWTDLAEGLGIRKEDEPDNPDFLDRIANAQDQIMREALTLNWFYFKNGLTKSTEREEFKNNYIEKLENGNPIELKAKKEFDQQGEARLKVAKDGTESLRVTQAGILAASHLVGAENATNFLFGQDEPKDENGTKVTKYFKDLENFNVQNCMLPVRSPERNPDGSPK